MNNKGVLLPTTAFDNEYDYLKKENQIRSRGVRYKIQCTWKCDLCK